jgi:hypothetical protein
MDYMIYVILGEKHTKLACSLSFLGFFSSDKGSTVYEYMLGKNLVDTP